MLTTFKLHNGRLQRRAFVFVTAAVLLALVAFVDSVEGKKKSLSSKPKNTKKLDADTKCSVCEALVEEIQWKLSGSNQMDLDLRWWLDPSGKRQGKTIPYRQSELAAVETLEVVCKEIKDYAISNKDTGKEIIRMNNPHSGSVTAENLSMDGKTGEKLEKECDSQLEELEERAEKAITSGLMLPEMEEALCYGDGGICGHITRTRRSASVAEALSAAADDDKGSTEEALEPVVDAQADDDEGATASAKLEL